MSGVGGPEAFAAGGVEVAVRPPLGVACPAAELVLLEEGGSPAAVAPVGACVGAAVLAGVTVRCAVRLCVAGAETTIFSAGAPPEPEPERSGGRCTVPESSSSAIAAAPRRSGSTGAATRRAIAQIARPIPPSLADNGPIPLPGLPFFRAGGRDIRNPFGRQPGRAADLRSFRGIIPEACGG
jgi:hypothetical protein